MLKTENDDAKKIGYMRLLEKTFKGAKKANALLAGFSKIADSGDGMFLFTDENVTRDVALKNIEDSYELIWGEFEKFDHLSRSVMKLCDIALYKVYGIKKHDPEYLEIFSEAPWILFGGTDENGIIDYAYALKSFINLIIFYIEFYDDKLLIQ